VVAVRLAAMVNTAWAKATTASRVASYSSAPSDPRIAKVRSDSSCLASLPTHTDKAPRPMFRCGTPFVFDAALGPVLLLGGLERCHAGRKVADP
jgi:hypothetical protein